jgi:TRAP-type C4-dicarboxylate transport system substrate-binding protein
MTDLKWAPLTGATIVTEKAWNRIPPELGDELARIIDEESVNLQQEVRALEAEAREAMIKRGLTIVPVDDSAMAAWLELIKTGYPQIRGTVVPAEYFDKTIRLRDEYRSLMAGK